ncbi:MAG: type II secretion system F family protein [Candidatus Hydrogenedentota bacterium]
MSRLKDILQYEITPKRKKKKKPSRSHGKFDIDAIKILMLFSGPLGLIYYFTTYKKVKLVRMMRLFTNIRMIIQNNAPLVQGLRMVAIDAPDRHISIVLHNVSNEIEQGASLTDALESYPNVFHPRYTDLVRIGERTGRLNPCLDQIMTSIHLRLDTARTVTTNMAFVISVLIPQFTIISFLVVKVLPVFEEISDEFGMPLTVPAQRLVDFSDFVLSHPRQIALFIFFMLICAPIYYIFHRYSLTLRYVSARCLFAIPVLGRILRLRQLHTVTEALEELVRAGVPLHEALESISKMNLAPPYQQSIASLAGKIDSGKSLKEALGIRPRLLGSTFTAVLGLGEYTGNLDEACARLKGLYQREFAWRVAVASEAMIPVYVIVGGAINLWILVSTHSMIFGLSDALIYSL